MDYLRQSIDIIWNRMDVNSYIKKYSSNCPMDKTLLEDDFVRLLVDCYHELTLEEAEGIKMLFSKKWFYLSGNDKSESLFNILVHFSDSILIESSGEPVCKYEFLLRWWQTTQLIGPDLPACAFFAYKDLVSNRKRDDFSWGPILSHNNYALNDVLSKGLSELHFHLKGSSLNFDLQWLSLMNDVSGRQSACDYLKRNKFVQLSESKCVVSYSIHDLVLLAADMRLWLYRKLVLREMSCVPELDPNSPVLYMSKLVRSLTIYKQRGRKYQKSQIEKGKVVDYAIAQNLLPVINETEKFVNSILQGERAILYHTLQFLYSHDSTDMDYEHVGWALLLYTAIKCKIRRELLLINDRKGFENFANYQDEKKLFIKKNSIYSELLQDLAIKCTCCNQPVKYLEYRIAPENTIEQNVKSIRTINNYSKKSYIYNEKIRKRENDVNKYAIIHFIKRKDIFRYSNYRNYDLRREVRHQSIVFKAAYEKNSLIRRCVCGFDAANYERFARPEVFAQAFRYLRGELYPQSSLITSIPALPVMFTFHVGEHFWDVMDGLRAIDEAVYFLELCDGDRIGHALALGTNAEEYYEKRHNSVIVPKQVLLDNLVWLYHKVHQLNITIDPAGFEYIQDRVSSLVWDIYHVENASMIELYESWRLRADDPLELHGEIPHRMVFNRWATYAISRATIYRYGGRQIPKNILNYVAAYHICREKGDVIVNETIPLSLVQTIVELQKKMLINLSEKHIAIEMNPTSNIRIGAFRRYDEHPIFTFKEKLSVSVNTDDQGVFDTNLMNEYSLLAIAMEKRCDSSGKRMHSSREVLHWIDDVREMAHAQRFVKSQ